MKLYIRQKVFSWVDKFTVRDEYGTDMFFVEGEFLSWGKKLHLSDAEGRGAAFIKEKVWSFLPRFFVYRGDTEVAEIVKEFTFFKPRYRIEGLGWEVNGSFWEHDYDITDGSRTVVTIHKQWMTWGDCYELDIAGGQDVVTALAVVLAIDCVLARQAAAASS